MFFDPLGHALYPGSQFLGRRSSEYPRFALAIRPPDCILSGQNSYGCNLNFGGKRYEEAQVDIARRRLI